MEGIVFTLLLLIASTAASTATSRTVTFINQCDTDYFIAPTSAAAPFVAGVSSCNANADCETGSSCLLTNHLCFYDVPTPTSGSFSVLSGKTNEINFPFYNNGDASHWVGNFGFCGGNMPCTQTEAICNQNGCGVAHGPINIAEINFRKNGDDYYDISNINGMNVPMSISPTYVSPSIFVTSNPYQCGTPGSLAPLTPSMGVSSWDPIPPSPYYQWVVPSSTTCLEDSDCPSGDSCGLTNTPGQTPQFKLSCGKLLGYWTANQVCGQDPTGLLTAGPFGCFTPVVNGPYATTLGAMQGCDGTSGSGYSDSATTSSCGCQDWYKLFGSEVVPLETGNCTSENPLWMAEILPTLKWLKEICPSCYVYPYDDKSSTFTCSYYEDSYNIQNYTVTLCPSESSPVAAATAAPTTAAHPKATSAPTTAAHPKATSAPTKAAVPTTAQKSSPTKAAAAASNANCVSCGTSESCCNDVNIGPTCYSTATYTCAEGSKGTVLCAIGEGACGTICYDMAAYQCCNGALSTASCSTATHRSLLNLDVDDEKTEFASDASHVIVGSWVVLFIVSFFIVNACV